MNAVKIAALLWCVNIKERGADCDHVNVGVLFKKSTAFQCAMDRFYHHVIGFNEDTKDIKHNFRQLDALPYAKEGTLQQKLDELFS